MHNYLLSVPFLDLKGEMYIFSTKMLRKKKDVYKQFLLLLSGEIINIYSFHVAVILKFYTTDR